jgi:hypothetical protein
MGTVRTSRTEWLDRVRGWVASGLPCREYASSLGINPRTLSWWRWKLERDGEDVCSSPPHVGRSLRPTFVELDQPQPVGWEISDRPGLSIELVVGETIVRLPDGFEGESLARVLDALEARR